MEIMKHTFFIYIASLFILNACQTKNNVNFDSLSREFYELNKEQDFDSLFNLSFVFDSNRTSVKYNIKDNKYDLYHLYVYINDTILFPLYKHNDSEKRKKQHFTYCNKNVIEYLKTKYNYADNNNLYQYYIKEVEYIYRQCAKIKIPKDIPLNNIAFNGYGNIIEFFVYNNNEQTLLCYYVKDYSQIKNQRLKQKLDTISKFDNNWFWEAR
jgi:hypothetical protein